MAPFTSCGSMCQRNERRAPDYGPVLSLLSFDLDDHAKLLAGVVGFLGDELVRPDRPASADDAAAAALAAGVLLARRVVRIDDAFADVIRGLVAGDLPPAARHVVEPPGVRTLGLDRERRLEALGAAAVLVLVLLGERWVGCANARSVFPLCGGRQTDHPAVLLGEDLTELVDVGELGVLDRQLRVLDKARILAHRSEEHTS